MGYVANVGLPDMITAKELVARRLMVIDARGRKVDRVRACKEENGGVHVLVLGSVDGGKLALCTKTSSGQLDVLELYGFIDGGRIVERSSE